MDIIQKVIKVKKKDYIRKHIEMISSILPDSLTKMELNIIMTFIELPENVKKGQMINPTTRRIVKDTLGISTAGLSNYINILVKKNFLLKDDITGELSLSSFVIPFGDSQGYQFKIIVDETD